MGLADRDYTRATGPRPGVLGALPRLSIVVWLIIINVAVFAIDRVAGHFHPVSIHVGDVFNQGFNPRGKDLRINTGVLAPVPSTTDPNTPGIFGGHPIVDAASGQLVGFRRVFIEKPLTAIGHFSTGKGFVELQVWRLVTFQFLHVNEIHLLLNMLGLWFFGPAIEQHLGSRRQFLAFYFVCGIAGALMYLALNLAGYLIGKPLPGLLFIDLYTPLIGASAGVFGVLLASAYVAGRETMYVFLVIPMKIRTGAYLMAAISVLTLLRSGWNAGGEAAHLGGAVAGFFFIRYPHLLLDFFDEFLFGGSSRKSPAPARPRPDRQARVDAILDKVHRQGLSSLTDAERRILERASKSQPPPPGARP
ncbi:MAG: rhomboid family intramembrane serine protease [Phycisphaerales bacterium]|nr:rhomboid family intramembrane serine protease [Phycisphaerales bacterium]